MTTRRAITDKEAAVLLNAACRQISRALKRLGIDPCVIKVTEDEMARLHCLFGALPQEDNWLHHDVVFQLWGKEDDGEPD